MRTKQGHCYSWRVLTRNEMEDVLFAGAHTNPTMEGDRWAIIFPQSAGNPTGKIIAFKVAA